MGGNGDGRGNTMGTTNSLSDALDKGAAQLLSSLRHFVDDLDLSERVIGALLPKGAPHAFETELWDYKERLPHLPDSPDEAARKRHKAELGDIIKDAVAFHNAYGGYIIFGIADSGSDRVVGCEGEFDCGDFNKRLQHYTEANIECLFATLQSSSRPDSKTIGLLLVPRRRIGATPVRFRKDGPEKPNGGRTFAKETYVRVRDECRPAASTSEDWRFLHSDRTPPDVASKAPRREVRGALPARDPDLVEFLGREAPLGELRRWLADPRSPVRLISGIGGLGKTTLAYRFAEEVVATGAGQLEWVIWLTAKQQTYSALRGRIIETGRVDFTDLASLYTQLLKVMSYQTPLEEEDDEPVLDELTERVVEALGIYTCLVIVDDIDSLTPDQQRETVAGLNSLALRTVGREIPPSRVLMTSRIDQGLPQTAVIKIPGLERDAFEKYVSNLCSTFGIAPITGSSLDAFYTATSGSPLFTASLIRLVSLGESLKDAIETWRGQDGEDVRRFAFEREIRRLDAAQGRLLYAVLLLGDTSVNDLAGVLEVTPRVVRDRISELQAYHLISSAIKEAGDTTIFAPNDLVAVTAIIQQHLGAHARDVEIACAKAAEQGKADVRTVGAGIRRVLSAWDVGRADEALALAGQLRARFPKSGDIASILGAAYLRTSPPKYHDADRELEAARHLGCSRPEMILNVVKVKTELQDWRGLYDFAKPLGSKHPSRDGPLNAFALACRNLIRVAKERGDFARVAELSFEVIEKINAKFNRQRLDPVLYSQLVGTRFDFAREYITAMDRLNFRDGDRLHVFEAVARLADADVILIDILKGGISALETWWRDVEKRPVVDLTACAILVRQISRLERIAKQLRDYGNIDPKVFTRIESVVRDLSYRGAKLSE